MNTLTAIAWPKHNRHRLQTLAHTQLLLLSVRMNNSLTDFASIVSPANDGKRANDKKRKIQLTLLQQRLQQHAIASGLKSENELHKAFIVIDIPSTFSVTRLCFLCVRARVFR